MNNNDSSRNLNKRIIVPEASQPLSHLQYSLEALISCHAGDGLRSSTASLRPAMLPRSIAQQAEAKS